jgi:hypothetical protein
VHRVHGLARKVYYIASPRSEGNAVIKVVDATAREDINKAVAVPIDDLDRFLIVENFPLDYGNDILDIKAFIYDSVFFHHAYLFFDFIIIFEKNQVKNSFLFSKSAICSIIHIYIFGY